MAARAMWKGTIVLDPDSKGTRALAPRVAVKLYAGVQNQRVAFHLLHGKDHARVAQRMVNPETGEAVEPKEIQKGFPVQKGVFVLIDKAEIEAATPKPSRDIEVLRFIPADGIEPAWFDRPYYLGPDGSTEAYFALAEALRASKREAVVHWVMRNQAYVGALRAYGPYLVLITLRHRDEMVAAPSLKESHARAADPKELALAQQLVSSLEGEFDPTEFKSEHRARLRELIARKARGERIAKPGAHKPIHADAQLAAMLKASLAGPKKAGARHAAKQKKSA